MKKEYQKPVAEMISLTAAEDIAAVDLNVDSSKIRLDDLIDGNMGTGSNLLGW